MHPRQIENRRDISHEMIVRNDIIEMEPIEQLALITLQPPHHRKTAPRHVCGDRISVRGRRQQTLQQNLPIPALSIRGNESLLDHLVSAREKRWWNGDAESLCSLEIDDQVVLGRRLHRKIARLLALQDAIDISGRPAPLILLIDSVT